MRSRFGISIVSSLVFATVVGCAVPPGPDRHFAGVRLRRNHGGRAQADGHRHHRRPPRVEPEGDPNDPILLGAGRSRGRGPPHRWSRGSERRWPASGQAGRGRALAGERAVAAPARRQDGDDLEDPGERPLARWNAPHGGRPAIHHNGRSGSRPARLSRCNVRPHRRGPGHRFAHCQSYVGTGVRPGGHALHQGSGSTAPETPARADVPLRQGELHPAPVLELRFHWRGPLSAQVVDRRHRRSSSPRSMAMRWAAQRSTKSRSASFRM